MMMMNKRNQSDVSSDSSGTSMLYNPETVFDLNAESSSGSARNLPRFNLNLNLNNNTEFGSARKIPRFNLNLNLNSSTEFGLFDDVQLNGAPFTDFFLSKPAKVSEKYSQNNTGVCLDLKLSLSLPLSDDATPVLSRTVLSDDATPVCRCESSTYLTDSETETETETETVLDVMPLRMYIPADVNVAVPVEVKWTVKKVLTISDCNDQHRLLISRNIAEPHILNNLDEASRKQVESPSGLRLDMFDYDTGSSVGQTMKRWPSSGSIALMDNWKRDFVVRRGLKAGDEVGLCYQRKVLLFSVLQRAPLIEN